MQVQRSLVVDSALIASLGTALCFFLGGAYEQGTAVGLGLPVEFVTRGDLWHTVAAGFDAALASVMLLPAELTDVDGVRWKAAIARAVSFLVLVLLLWFTRKSKLASAALLAVVTFALFIHIHTTATINTLEWVRKSENCLRGEGCPAARRPHKVTYVLPDGEKREGTGMFLSMNSKFLIMFSNGGLLIVPVESLREIVTAMPLPGR